MDGVPRFNVVLRCFLKKVFYMGVQKYGGECQFVPIMRCRLLNVVQEFVNNREVADQLSC